MLKFCNGNTLLNDEYENARRKMELEEYKDNNDLLLRQKEEDRNEKRR